jgi:hypothetical protein
MVVGVVLVLVVSVRVVMTGMVLVPVAVVLVARGRSGVLVVWRAREMMRTGRILAQGSRRGKEEHLESRNKGENPHREGPSPSPERASYQMDHTES